MGGALYLQAISYLHRATEDFSNMHDRMTLEHDIKLKIVDFAQQPSFKSNKKIKTKLDLKLLSYRIKVQLHYFMICSG